MTNPSLLTGEERFFPDNEIIVSKTDARGIITYANHTFLDVAEYTLGEVLGKPHNIIRHPFMPRGIFRLLWEAIKAEREIFAYVVNRTKPGDYYWVFANVTPSFDGNGKVSGYHSNRRAAERKALDTIIPLYQKLLTIESQQSTPKQASEASVAALQEILTQKGISYDEFILAL